MYAYRLRLACGHHTVTVPLPVEPDGSYRCGCCNRPQLRRIVGCERARDIVSEYRQHRQAA